MYLFVKGQALELEGGNVIAEGAVEFASFTLECDSSWDGYSRTVRFRHTSQEDTFDVAGVVDGKVYYIPAEVLVRGSVFVSVLGTKGNTRISTTELAGFFVEGTVDSGKTPSVTENAYAQYVSMVNECVDASNSSAESAETFCSAAEEHAISAQSSEQSCRDSAAACKQYAVYCEKVSAETSGAEQSMNLALEGVRDSINTLLSHDHSLSVAESERHASENARMENERIREACEEERRAAEQKRAEAEAERISAERGRVTGELEREARLATLENNAKKLADSIFTSASAIIGKAEGKSVSVSDAEAKAPISLEIRGETLQEGTPSRLSPAELNGVGANASVSLFHIGKNFIPYPYAFSTEIVVNGARYTPYSDGGIRVTGATASVKSTVELCTSDYTLEAGRYIASGGTASCGVYVYDADNSEYIARSNGGEAEFTLDVPTKIKVRLYIFPEFQLNEVVYPMIRYYGTSSDYEQWCRRVYLPSVADTLYSAKDVSDRLVLADFAQGPFLEKNIGELVLDGTEFCGLFESGDEYNVFSVLLDRASRIYPKGELEGTGYCTHLPYSDAYDGECCWAEDDTLFIKLNAKEFSNVASVSAFLSKAYSDGLPFKVIYTLAQSCTEKCDGIELELIEDFNRIYPNEGYVSLEYVRSTNTVFETIIDALVSLDARVSLLEV